MLSKEEFVQFERTTEINGENETNTSCREKNVTEYKPGNDNTQQNTYTLHKKFKNWKHQLNLLTKKLKKQSPKPELIINKGTQSVQLSPKG